MAGPAMFYAPLTVVDVDELGPRVRRVRLGGAGLDAFVPVAPDQQAKLFFARDGGVPELPDPPADRAGVPAWYGRYLAVPEPRRPWMRSYTVRRHWPDERVVEIDFVLHDGSSGPASRWAAAARPGDVLGFYGPSVSHFCTVSPGAAMLLAGDATALPAIAAWLESFVAGQRATVHIEVDDADYEQELATAGDVEVHWHHRGHAGSSTVLVDAVAAAGRPPGALVGWLAGEASTVRALRRLMVGEWGMAKRQVAFAGYWRRHLSQDDAPTAEDLAEATEAVEAMAGD